VAGGPGAGGVIDLVPFEFLDRLADLVPPPRKHRYRYHRAFAPNHKLRAAVTALAIGDIGKQRHAATAGHASDGYATGGGCDATQKTRSHDTSRIAWAKLMARVGEQFPLQCPEAAEGYRAAVLGEASSLKSETPLESDFHHSSPLKSKD
jgi:hypothetical protein